MKVLLTTLNSKFIHSSLALRYLRAYCRDKPWNLKVREFTINDLLLSITGEIYSEAPDIVALSCYIWNITETLALARRIKQVKQDTVIVLGGPEVSYDASSLMEKYSYIDFIVRGEGEETFRELLEHVIEGKGYVKDISGITYRQGRDVVENSDRKLICDLDSIPFPYGPDDGLKNRIVYYEASRGCPFRCQYCLSSTIRGVRFFSIDRVKRDLDRLVDMGVKQVKFVDRTFNCQNSFSREIFRHLIQRGGGVNFHFEITADLLDGETMRLLNTAPPGLFQFEIGVQTTNKRVLKEIRRNTRQEALFENVRRISQGKNIHQHLDLIAGLPGEDMQSFAKSFDDVFGLAPDMLQLGFLKLLKGSGIRQRAEEYGYAFTAEPPYEVLFNKWMDYGDLRRLKLIEQVLEYYYNNHGFDNTLAYMFSSTGKGPFALLKDLSEYWEERKLHLIKHSRKKLYSLLYEYCKDRLKAPARAVNELLKLDFLLTERTFTLPQPISRIEVPAFKQKCFDFLARAENIKLYLPDYEGLAPKHIYKLVHFEIFDSCITDYVPALDDSGGSGSITVLFDYGKREKLRGKASIIIVSATGNNSH